MDIVQYVFVVIDHGSRRLLHFNVTAHPTAAWTLQQLREAIGFEDNYRHLIRDRDSIFFKSLDKSIESLGRDHKVRAAQPDGQFDM